jgi:membrane protein DedA with SNARE-associated domain
MSPSTVALWRLPDVVAGTEEHSEGQVFDWIVNVVQQTGYLGIALLMLAENVFPPMPSELIMPLAGFTAAQGQLNIVLVILAGTVGSILGALFWYYIGLRFGCARFKRWSARHGRWLTMTPEDVDQAVGWFERHGGAAVLVGRLVPTVRTLISVPAGMVRMPMGRFLLYSSLGTAAWTAILAGAGYLLESQYQKVADYVNPVSNAVFGLILVWYLYRVVTFRSRQTEG